MSCASSRVRPRYAAGVELLGFLLQPTYRVRDGRPVVQLYGRAAPREGRPGLPFLVEDDRERPYFFAAEDTAKRLSGRRGVTFAPTALVSLEGRSLCRVSTRLPAEVPPLRDRLGPGNSFEADVRFPIRYLLDRDIRAGVRIRGETKRAGGVLRFRNPEVTAATVEARLTRLSIDLETTPDASEIFSAALVGDDIDEVWLVRPPASEAGAAARGSVAGARCVPDEKALLRAVHERIREVDPDVMVGWNVVDFDLRVFAARCVAHRLPTDLGRDPGEIRFLDERGPGGRRAEIPGRVVLDGLPLAREALRLEDYRLDTVARAVVGRGKRLDSDVPDKAAEILRLRREDPDALVAYNREDARLVLDILDGEGLFSLCVERSQLCGMPLDRVGASIASFDRLYLPALRRVQRVAPNVASDRSARDLGGGAVLEPVAGFHRDVVVYDFKSLYPSLICTFGLDPMAHACAAPAETVPDLVVAPNGARFARSAALLPSLIRDLMRARAEATARGDQHARQAIKIMMNSLYGVLGATSCRFFDPEVANAITSFGQQTLAWAREAFEAAGERVLYGDTDSVFVALGNPQKAEALRQRVEASIDARIRREYGVASALELELDAHYHRFFLPRVRGGRGGSKKRYAGWTDRGLRTIGLEAVRRDWPAIAGRLQTGMLERAFRDEPVLPFVRAVVDEVREGRHDEALIYRKRVRKASLDRYTTKAPHVVAARKLGARAGSVVRYVITPAGPEPLHPGQAPPAELDRKHYVERVLRPVAESILEELGESFDAALGNPTQMSLL